ncbi:hypothetical protein E2562_033204 [Oryza meyeriana var. granulata]|uniref:Uncharacterized protein n=1 Tax=Oryza meyeriana var. granulata TaxID=110450 RepID=A0A6G1CWI4_9ORYZ|nr:hypothetical protein E2562_033204 [Oryza meyeriana var. granulata]
MVAAAHPSLSPVVGRMAAANRAARWLALPRGEEQRWLWRCGMAATALRRGSVAVEGDGSCASVIWPMQ